MAKYSLTDFRREFPTDDACLAYLFAKRWGQHGPVCTCGKRDSFHKVAGRRTYACAWCGAQLSPTAGTIFDHSPTPLRASSGAIAGCAGAAGGRVSRPELVRDNDNQKATE
jgi:hypothetical protein